MRAPVSLKLALRRNSRGQIAVIMTLAAITLVGAMSLGSDIFIGARDAAIVAEGRTSRRVLFCDGLALGRVRTPPKTRALLRRFFLISRGRHLPVVGVDLVHCICRKAEHGLRTRSRVRGR